MTPNNSTMTPYNSAMTSYNSAMTPYNRAMTPVFKQACAHVSERKCWFMRSFEINENMFE